MNRQSAPPAGPGWIRKQLVPIFSLFFVAAITAGIFYFYKEYPEKVNQLQSYSYLGAFIISVTFNATLILPAGNMVVLVALGANLPMPGPVIVGLVGGTGAAIGEMTGYIAGRSGRDLLARGNLYHRVEHWVQRWGGLTIFVFSIVPLVFDLVGIATGALRYSFWKFVLFCWLGRMVLYVTVITLASLGLKSFFPWL
jgi:membrane protein YqaA with SNARE-associated domain